MASYTGGLGGTCPYCGFVHILGGCASSQQAKTVTSVSVAPVVPIPYSPPGCSREELARDILLKLLEVDGAAWAAVLARGGEPQTSPLARRVELSVEYADALLAALSSKPVSRET